MPQKVILNTKFKVDVYTTTINVIVMADSAAVSKKVKELYKRHNTLEGYIPSKCHGYTIMFSDKSRLYYVLYAAEGLSYNTITHEAHHLSKFITDFNGVNEKEYAEAEAYLNGFINDNIIKILHNSGIDITYEQ